MILSKEIQQNAVNEYLKNNSVEKTEAFIDGMNKAFELIIPKEEPKQGTMSEAIKEVINNQLKQETFEEVAERLFDIYSIYTSLGEDVYEYTMDKEDFKEASLEIAKWQQEQINCDFTVAFAIFLRQKCLIDDNYLYYFFNGKKYNETELLQHFKNNIYDN